jgi:hypothetical protein
MLDRRTEQERDDRPAEMRVEMGGPLAGRCAHEVPRRGKPGAIPRSENSRQYDLDLLLPAAPVTPRRDLAGRSSIMRAMRRKRAARSRPGPLSAAEIDGGNREVHRQLAQRERETRLL